MNPKQTIIVSGMIAANPGQGGAAWAVLQYVLVLRRLGYDVVVMEREPLPSEQALDVLRRTGDQVVDGDDLVAALQQGSTEVRSKEPGATGDDDPRHGPASYARAYVTGAKGEPFAIEVSGDGTMGYYSVLYVKKDAPYKTIQDLKGKNLCLVDPNSTSGNNVPRFAMHKMGIEPDKFFSKVVYAGSHENAVIALDKGTVDVAANWWNAEDDSNLTRMAKKGMVKKHQARPRTGAADLQPADA